MHVLEDGTLKIINSVNYGDVNSNDAMSGGIIGSVKGQNWADCFNLEVVNCANYADVCSKQNVCGGILGNQGTVCKENFATIRNTYNMGKTTGKIVGNIIGVILTSSKTDTKTDLENVYYTEGVSLGQGSLTSGEATLKSLDEIKSQTFVDLLNQNIGENTDWKKWKLGEKGYPELDL